MQIVSSVSLVREKASYLDAVLGQPHVTELDPDDISCQQVTSVYFVQSPDTSEEENVEVIPTPPMVEEVQIRLSQRTAGGNMEHMGIRAEKLTKKRNLQGNEISPNSNSFEILSNLKIVNTASMMGVEIPDNNFTVIDVIRELEKSRANIAEKVENTEKQKDNVLFITNAAGDKSPLNTNWVRDGEVDEEEFTVVRSRRRDKKKVNVVISKPVTRSQKNKMSFDAGSTMLPGKPSNKGQSPKCKKK
ncbi:hypothetical protein VPH35_110683 [Triticum aestivum]